MNRASGFTLLELMIAIVILAIVTSLAAPPMKDFMNRHRSDVQRQRLFDLIALARSNAYSEGSIFTLCPLDHSNQCGTDWSGGVQLFVDNNANEEKEVDELLVREMPALPAGASLQWNSGSSYLQYRPNGQTRWQLGNFAYCPPDGNTKNGWIIILNATGRPYSGRDNDNNGTVENGSGVNLVCTAGS